MNRNWLFLFCALVLTRPALAQLDILACEPEWAALAEAIGGERVEVESATTALQDPHRVQARPSLLSRARRADLLFCTGAGLEAGWLPLLIRRAGNPGIQPGQPGHLMAAEHVELLGVPASLDRSLGDLHPQGNPHIHLDPRRVLAVADELVHRLVRLDGGGTAGFQLRHAAFRKRMETAIEGWTIRAAKLAGSPVVVLHDSWLYLEQWTGLRRVATVEPRPGLPPSGAHLQNLVTVIGAERPRALLLGPADSRKSADWLGERTGLEALTLPFTVGGSPRSSDLFGLYDETLRLLEEHLR